MRGRLELAGMGAGKSAVSDAAAYSSSAEQA